MTKNNPDKRRAAAQVVYNGKPVQPAFYKGRHAGHGEYMSIQYSGTQELVLCEDKRPMKWSDLKSKKS